MASDRGKSGSGSSGGGGAGRSTPNARARAAAAREAQRKQDARRKFLITGGITVVVLAVVAAMVLVFALKGDKKNAALRQPATAAVVDDVTKVPAATYASVGAGATTGKITKISGDPLTADGKPQVFYYGAEFCPYCATERWAVVAALSRFGTWSNLQTTTSSSQDMPASIPTFSFYGAKYSSPYIAFDAVETTTNQQKNGSYEKLETPSAAQSALVAKYDGPDGSIPFIDFGNKFMIAGATYDYSVLQGKSHDEIAASIKDPSTDVSKGVLGAANQMTAAICTMTGGKPATVCNAPEVKTLQTQINAS